jgi:hypothetical protein
VAQSLGPAGASLFSGGCCFETCKSEGVSLLTSWDVTEHSTHGPDRSVNCPEVLYSPVQELGTSHLRSQLPPGWAQREEAGGRAPTAAYGLVLRWI